MYLLLLNSCLSLIIWFIDNFLWCINNSYRYHLYFSSIRNIIEAPIPMLNKVEFRKLFMEDKMWSVMKNMPDWLNNTWLSLSAFAQKTK